MFFNTSKFYFWSERIILIKRKDDETYWNFIAFDLLTNEKRSLRFRKSDKTRHYVYVYPLSDGFAFIVEKYGVLNFVSRVNLVKLNWDTDEFELIESFDREAFLFQILVDKLNPSKFVWGWKLISDFHWNYQSCKLMNGKLEFDEVIQQPERRNFDCYYNGKLIQFILGQLKIYDMTTKKEESIEINRSCFAGRITSLEAFEWSDKCCYMKVLTENKESWKIAYADLETKQLKLLDFETDLEDWKYQVFGNKLIAVALKFDGERSVCVGAEEIFSISIKRPNSLRESAWRLLVKAMEKKGEKDSYLTVKEFLPLNSDLQAPWFKDEEQLENGKKIN